MLLTQNSKLKSTSKKHGIRIYAFNLPPIQTCPQAGICRTGCYAQQGRYAFKAIRAKLQLNLTWTYSPNFPQLIQAELIKLKPTHVRLHTSGDFYGASYLEDWLALAEHNPSIVFYAYTKSIVLVKGYIMPDNMVMVYSLGGLQDALIRLDRDRHTRVFSSLVTLYDAGYVDGSHDDTVCLGQCLKIGLVYHGTRHIRNTDWR